MLALAEWQSKGNTANADERLRYERVVDIFTSYKHQTLVYLTLDNGQTLTATEGHPFKTTDGWRDAILLKKGGKLLLKRGDADGERNIGIADVRTEQKTIQVFNLEVANAHTFFVGVDGVLVHNGKYCGSYKEYNKGDSWARRVFDRLTGGNSTSPRPGTSIGQDAKGRTVNIHESSTQGGRPTVEIGSQKNPVAKHRY